MGQLLDLLKLSLHSKDTEIRETDIDLVNTITIIYDKKIYKKNYYEYKILDVETYAMMPTYGTISTSPIKEYYSLIFKIKYPDGAPDLTIHYSLKERYEEIADNRSNFQKFFKSKKFIKRITNITYIIKMGDLNEEISLEEGSEISELLIKKVNEKFNEKLVLRLNQLSQ